MKEYLVFGWKRYYPDGGFLDFKASFDDLEEAIKYVMANMIIEFDFAQIIRPDCFKVVRHFELSTCGSRIDIKELVDVEELIETCS